MSNETIVIFKNDAVGDLVHSIPAIHKIIENSGDKKITVFLSKRSKNFSFLINGKNIAIKILNYDLTLYDRFLILKYLFNNKIKNAYILTPKGVAQKTKLTLNFMQRKMKEYDELKSEIEEDN